MSDQGMKRSQNLERILLDPAKGVELPITDAVIKRLGNPFSDENRPRHDRYLIQDIATKLVTDRSYKADLIELVAALLVTAQHAYALGAGNPIQSEESK